MELTGKTILVSGASGFIGRRLAERLAREHQASVRALVRSAEKGARLQKEFEQLAIEPVIGDLSDLASLQRAAAGCQIVFHCAAWVSDRGSRDDFFQANVTGTSNIVAAAQSAGCQRFIHTSSVGVYGLNPKDGTDESYPFNTSNNLYCETKIESEEVIKRAITAEKFAAVILRPGSVYGPRSAAWTVRPIKAIKDNKMFLVSGGSGLINYIYIDNLIDGMLLAAQNDQVIGEDFIITDGRTATWHEFFGYYTQMLGQQKLRSLPLPVAQLAALSMEIGEKITGKKAALSRTAVGFLTRRATFNISKAKRLLGYQPTIELAAGMRMTEEWLRAEKMI